MGRAAGGGRIFIEKQGGDVLTTVFTGVTLCVSIETWPNILAINQSSPLYGGNE